MKDLRNPSKKYYNYYNRIGIDIMNSNAIISLAMLYALWKTQHKDLLDLIKPFVLYAVGSTTQIGNIINISEVCSCLENEFGYKSFQSAVVTRILDRERSSSIPINERKVERVKHNYRLIGSYNNLIDSFRAKRTECKAHSDSVSTALTVFLNENNACNRTNYTQGETESLLLSFFAKQGGSVVLSVEDLRQLTVRKNEIDFYIGRFILKQHEERTVLIDYLVELVAGYFVTTALYLQAENRDITKAAYKNVTFFLDTRLLLAFLGYKSAQENDSIQEMVRSLQKNGARIACFQYNVDEVKSILEAYHVSLITKSRRGSTSTLEYFDENGKSSTHVELAQRYFLHHLKTSGIEVYSPDEALKQFNVDLGIGGLLDDSHLRAILLNINPKYNFQTLPDDLTAINTVSRIRKGERIDYVEKCKAVFVTTNIALVLGTKQLLKEDGINVGFPIVVSSEDLCVLAWIKDFERNDKLPKMRLLENVLAAISPGKDLLDSYFDHIEDLEKIGDLTPEEASVLRVDYFARNELMTLTKGDNDNLSNDTVKAIKDKLFQDSMEKGIEIGRKEAEKKEAKAALDRRNKACKKAEDEVEAEYYIYEKKTIKRITVMAFLLSVILIAASALSVYYQLHSTFTWLIIIASLVSTVQGVMPLLSHDNFAIRLAKKRIQKKKLAELDARKEKILNYLDD